MRLLKDVLIETGEIDKYFDGSAPVTLWRAKRKSQSGEIFELVEKPLFKAGGIPRPADIKIEKRADGQEWVSVEFFPRGISTFDKPKTFKGTGWEYYRIEAGIELPNGLTIVKDGYNRNYGAHHYTIAPAWDMPLSEFKALLRYFVTFLIKEVA